MGCVQYCASKTRCKINNWFRVFNICVRTRDGGEPVYVTFWKKIPNFFKGEKGLKRRGMEWKKNTIFVWLELMNAWKWKTEETYILVIIVPNYSNNEYKIIALITMTYRPEWMAAVICSVAWIAYAATYRLNILRCIKTIGNVDGIT